MYLKACKLLPDSAIVDIFKVMSFRGLFRFTLTDPMTWLSDRWSDKDLRTVLVRSRSQACQ